jgi:hypothetical protein
VVEILRSLRDEYEAPAETFEADVAALLDRLREMGLIERVSV